MIFDPAPLLKVTEPVNEPDEQVRAVDPLAAPVPETAIESDPSQVPVKVAEPLLCVLAAGDEMVIVGATVSRVQVPETWLEFVAGSVWVKV